MTAKRVGKAGVEGAVRLAVEVDDVEVGAEPAQRLRSEDALGLLRCAAQDHHRPGALTGRRCGVLLPLNGWQSVHGFVLGVHDPALAYGKRQCCACASRMTRLKWPGNRALGNRSAPRKAVFS
jgi:hypothetical protein